MVCFLTLIVMCLDRVAYNILAILLAATVAYYPDA